MTIVNMGDLQRRKSALEGMPEALAKGIELGQRNRQLNIMTAATRVKAANTQSMVQRRMAENAYDQARQDEIGRKATIDSLEKASMLNAQDSQKYQMFLQTPAGKEYIKHVKQYAPEFVSDDGSLLLPPPKDVFAHKLESQKADLVAKVQAVGGVQNLTKGEKDAWSFLNTHNVDAFAQALTTALVKGDLQLQGGQLTPDAQQKIITNYVKVARAAAQVDDATAHPSPSPSVGQTNSGVINVPVTYGTSPNAAMSQALMPGAGGQPSPTPQNRQQQQPQSADAYLSQVLQDNSNQ